MPKSDAAKTPDEYIEQIDEPRRSEVSKLHEIISRAVPDLEPSIQSGIIGYGTYHYKYESGREGDAAVIALASRKDYISVYLSASENGQYLAEKHSGDFPKASVGKSCIRFKKLADIDLKALEKLLKAGARSMKAR